MNAMLRGWGVVLVVVTGCEQKALRVGSSSWEGGLAGLCFGHNKSIKLCLNCGTLLPSLGAGWLPRLSMVPAKSCPGLMCPSPHPFSSLSILIRHIFPFLFYLSGSSLWRANQSCRLGKSPAPAPAPSSSTRPP